MSGSALERPELQRALAEARLHRYDLLLVYRVDRLSRSVRGLPQILEELDQAGVHFRSATEPFDTGTPAGRMMVQVLGAFAEFERATLIDRVIAGMERKAARGEWLGGNVSFGYRHSAEGGVLELEDSEAPLVPVMFDLYVNKRVGYRAIAMWLNERGHRSRAGHPLEPHDRSYWRCSRSVKGGGTHVHTSRAPCLLSPGIESSSRPRSTTRSGPRGRQR